VALHENDMTTFQGLLAAGVNVSETKAGSGATVLYAAVAAGNLEAIRALLAAKADPNQRHANSTAFPLARTPAITPGHDAVQAATALLDAGADVNMTQNNNLDALCIASILPGDKSEVMKLLLSRNADVNHVFEITETGSDRVAYGSVPLTTALQSRRTDVAAFLLSANADTSKALFYSASAKQAQAIPFLISHGADVNQRRPEVSDEADTPLLEAARNNYVEMIRGLLSAKADINQGSRLNGNTALHIAAKHSFVRSIVTLVAAKADVEKRNHGGGTPLLAAIGSNSIEAVHALLAANADVNHHVSMKQVMLGPLSPLYVAVVLGKEASIVRALLHAGAEVDASDSLGVGALGRAAELENLDLLEALLEAKADVNKRTITGTTPLFMSAQGGKLKAVRALLSAGANVDMTNAEGATPLMAAAKNNNVEVVRTLLRAKAAVDRPLAIPRTKTGVDAEGLSMNGSTALGWASLQNHVKIIVTLVAAKADVNWRAVSGETPLYLAAKVNSANAVEALLASKAEVDKPAWTGWTPLRAAVEGQHVEAVQILLAAGADVASQASDGATPLARAKELPNERIEAAFIGVHSEM